MHKSKDAADLEVRKVVDSTTRLLLCQHVQLPISDFKHQDPALCQQQACQVLLPIPPPGTKGNSIATTDAVGLQPQDPHTSSENCMTAIGA